MQKINSLIDQANIKLKRESDSTQTEVGPSKPSLKGFEDTKSALYNLTDDPGQLSPINDEEKSKEYQKIMINIINEYDPPHELIKNYFKNN
mgnify:CR=1 FL=1